jgi:hypothetical protein
MVNASLSFSLNLDLYLNLYIGSKRSAPAVTPATVCRVCQACNALPDDHLSEVGYPGMRRTGLGGLNVLAARSCKSRAGFVMLATLRNGSFFGLDRGQRVRAASRTTPAKLAPGINVRQIYNGKISATSWPDLPAQTVPRLPTQGCGSRLTLIVPCNEGQRVRFKISATMPRNRVRMP